MHIMFIGFDLNPPFQTTASRVVYELSRQLIEDGNKISVLTSGHPYFLKNLIDGIELIQVPLHTWGSDLNTKAISKSIDKKEPPDIINGIGGLYSMWCLIRALKKIDLPYLFTLTTGGFPSFDFRKYCLKAAIEFGLDYGCNNPFTTLSTLLWSHRFMSKTFIEPNLKGIIVPTNRLRNYLYHYLINKKNLKPIFCIPFGVDTLSFIPNPHSLASEPVIIYFGHANRHRGFSTLLKAMRLVLRKIPNARLRVYTPSAPTVSIANDSSINVTVGLLKNIKEAINESSVAVFPFHFTIPELPLTVLESMSAGKAIVTTNILGLQELIKEGFNGFLVEPYDSKKLAERIICILSDNYLRRRLGNSARESVLRFDWKVVAEKFLQIYRHTIEEGN